MARASSRRSAKKNVTTVDMTGVESGGGGFRIKKGDYLMAVTKIEDTESNSGNQMLKWTFEGKEKAAKGKKFYQYTVYDPPDSLWKLRSLLEALSVDVPDSSMDIDHDEMIGLELIGHVDDEEYDGKVSSKMQDFSPVGDGEEADEEDDEEEKKPAKGKKKSAKDESDEEDDEDEKPAKGAKKGGKKAPKLDVLSSEDVKAMDDDDMADVVERYELDVELKDHKTPRRKASAIIAALEEKELLNDD